MRVTKHNGRSGKNGVYNPKHNDRSFNAEASEHIDPERMKQNIYWDWVRGYSSWEDHNPAEDVLDLRFDAIERSFYYSQYDDFCEAQNERNRKSGHSRRNRSTEDLRHSKKTCPEESLIQIGTREEHVSGEVLLEIAKEYFAEYERRFGEHVHILDWGLHVDEATPHIHERHVFDCENAYGEIAPQQEKALEALGIPLPFPDQKSSRTNNRKVMFDSICRTMLIDIAKQHGLQLEEEPIYGGREYLEKQDYILMKQKEKLQLQEREMEQTKKQLREASVDLLETKVELREKTAELADTGQQVAQQASRLDELTLRIDDVDALLEEMAENAYDNAVLAVTQTVRDETRNSDFAIIEEHRRSVMQDPKYTEQGKTFAAKILDGLMEKFRGFTERITARLDAMLHDPATREKNIERIREQAKPSVLGKLHRMQAELREERRNRPPERKGQRSAMEL